MKIENRIVIATLEELVRIIPQVEETVYTLHSKQDSKTLQKYIFNVAKMMAIKNIDSSSLVEKTYLARIDQGFPKPEVILELAIEIWALKTKLENNHFH